MKRNLSSAFEAKTAGGTLKKNRTLFEITQQQEIYTNQILTSKIFSDRGERDPGADIRARENKSGQLPVDNIFFNAHRKM